MKSKKGYFKYFLAMDCETSGLQPNSFTPFLDKNGGRYQAVSWGLQVVDAITLKAVDELYVEIQWNGESLWDDRAEQVHGLSKEYLEEHGVTEEEAVCEIGNLIVKWWGGTAQINGFGHNVATFDIPFLIELFERHGIPLKFSHRCYDTTTLALILMEQYNSDDLFEELSLPPRCKHNALEDVKLEVLAAKRLKQIFNIALNGI